MPTQVNPTQKVFQSCLVFAVLVESAPRGAAEDSSLSESVRATIKENDLTCENYGAFCQNAAVEATPMPSERVVIVNACRVQVNKELHCT
ncbi:hypothetical protein TSAR_012785 [Trichomalopsis sarcophagae]|uniref:Uncharacterized protein n=1 Tax=Trichomalopsis sarcophagae TaxID=543379 RepID=A0A232EZN0_9HYME|nr:hypothetical protein TSAR_012785 [Trichomalopsis sarcophagae]